jgi:drug/metabolite transporter (DMT)-like permease
MLFSAAGYGERIGWREIAGISISLVGVLLIVARGAPESLATISFNVGDLLVLAAVLLWTVYTVLLKVWPTSLPPLAFLMATMLLGVPALILGSALELTLGSRVPSFDAYTVLAALYLGLFPSIAAYMLWGYGVTRIGPTRAMHFQYLIPVFAAALAITLIGESLHWFHVGGALLIVGGLSLATLRPSAS